MTDSGPQNGAGSGPPDEDGIGLAAEYVLGLLGAEERAAAERRLRDDPAFRYEVAAWSERMAALAEEEVSAAAVPPAVWSGIEAKLFPETRQSWLRRLGIVPAILGAAAAAGLAWLALSLGWLGAPGPVPTLQAQIEAESGALQVAVALDPLSGQLALERVEGGAAPGRVLELWLIEDGGVPRSLGVLPEETLAQLDLPADAVLDGALLAISDEPPGGSPTGQPTGEVLAVGPILPI